MKMLSVLQRMVENGGRTAIRRAEWFLWMRDEREKSNVNPRILCKTKLQRVRHPKLPATQKEVLYLRRDRVNCYLQCCNRSKLALVSECQFWRATQKYRTFANDEPSKYLHTTTCR